MTILLVLIPLGCLLLAVAIAAFLWAVRNDQFEDLELEGRRILWDDDDPGEPKFDSKATSKAGAPIRSQSRSKGERDAG